MSKDVRLQNRTKKLGNIVRFLMWYTGLMVFGVWFMSVLMDKWGW